MNDPVAPTALDEDVLDKARAEAEARGLGYAGDIDPATAARLAERGAVLVDVRTAEELAAVGRPIGGIHIPWRTGAAMTLNDRFLAELEAAVAPETPVLFLCRSGRRSVDAALAASGAGYRSAFNIVEGFEGDVGPTGERSTVNGWRFRNLPWQRLTDEA